MRNSTDFRRLTQRDFAWFGFFERAYIKPVSVDGQTHYAVFAADGSLISHAPDRRTAQFIVVEQYSLALMSIH